MMDDDAYPPYPQDRYRKVEMKVRGGGQERDLVVLVVAGMIAGVAAGALLVVYGLF